MRDRKYYWDIGVQCVAELETEQGILASAKDEAYGCIFGRDSLITCLKLLRVSQKTGMDNFLPLIRKVLFTLMQLQGKEENIESGEQPGKCIHEFRPTAHEHLTKNGEHPWYVYPDNSMRNYDSVDATPLFLIGAYRYWQITGDREFLKRMLPAVEAALQWIMEFGDTNRDGLIDYTFPANRRYGGLVIQNWMDSMESALLSKEQISYPIAPVEVQAYTFLALRLWSGFYGRSSPQKEVVFGQFALRLKKRFNEVFILPDIEGKYSLAYQVDGQGRVFSEARSSMGHCLWASLTKEQDGVLEGILEQEQISFIVERLLRPDLFEPQAGIRTLSTQSSHFNPNSYHNGTIWPHDNGMIAEGFEIYGYKKEAQMVQNAVLEAIAYFGTPIELFVYQNKNDGYQEYRSVHGQCSCKKQAWSAATILDMVSSQPEFVAVR